MEYNHPRTGKAHYPAYPLPHIRPIAVDGTPEAGRLAVAVRTHPETISGIRERFAAIRAHTAEAVTLAAVKAYHRLHCRDLFLYAIMIFHLLLQN